MKKGWLIVGGIVALVLLGLCLGLGGLFFSGIFALTQPVVDASEEFLSLLGQGRITEAYAATADGFRVQQNEPSFTVAVQQLGLTDYASVSWHSRQIKNQEGSVQGTVTTKNGSTKPIAVQLIREGDKWKVVGVRYGGVDVVAIKATLPVPSPAQLEVMVRDALLSFNQAVQAKDFTTFYGNLSNVWKKQTTPDKLQEIFQEFIDKQINLDFIKNLKPQLARPSKVNSTGILVIAGSYSGIPPLEFQLEYTQERGDWKLISLSVKVGK
jgi:hypothetical protein